MKATGIVRRIENLGGVVNLLKEEGHRIYDVEIQKEQHEHISSVSAVFTLLLAPKCSHTEVLAEISTVNGIVYVEEIIILRSRSERQVSGSIPLISTKKKQSPQGRVQLGINSPKPALFAHNFFKKIRHATAWRIFYSLF